MAQVSWRAPDELVAHVKDAAAREGRRPDPVLVAEARRALGGSGVLASDMVSEGRG